MVDLEEMINKLTDIDFDTPLWKYIRQHINENLHISITADGVIETTLYRSSVSIDSPNGRPRIFTDGIYANWDRNGNNIRMAVTKGVQKNVKSKMNMVQAAQILGVPQNATEDQVRRAYRNLAMRYHPDRNTASDATTRFQNINEANRVFQEIFSRRRQTSQSTSSQRPSSSGSTTQNTGRQQSRPSGSSQNNASSQGARRPAGGSQNINTDAELKRLWNEFEKARQIAENYAKEYCVIAYNKVKKNKVLVEKAQSEYDKKPTSSNAMKLRQSKLAYRQAVLGHKTTLVKARLLKKQEAAALNRYNAAVERYKKRQRA
ncbi:MAG: J domain-containing protein [Alphaproteobacteria bacterium]|nr:J domain-containing protein [Alphaproteobacteria bacterium]